MGEIFKTIFQGIGGPLFFIFGLLAFLYALSYIELDIAPIFSVMIALTPLWLPWALFYLAFDRWMYYVTNKFAYQNGRTTLRIHLPPLILKSPETMESVLSYVHNTQNPDNLMQTYIDGKSPLTMSLELVSIGGEVRFYVNCPTKKVKNAFEAALYAQYPGIEVVEEEFDYVDEISWDPDKYEIMSFHMGKKSDSILPIKTYIDFGLDKLPKEEEKFEPMAAMLEQLGKAQPHERIWIQILCIPHGKKEFKNGYLTPEGTWEADAKAYIDKTLKRDKRVVTDEDTQERAPLLTLSERDTIAAVERNVGKYAYEVGIRWMYITKKGKFNGDFISPMIRSFAQYDIIGRNGIGARWRTDFNYKMFSDPSGRRVRFWKKDELDHYKARYYYYRDRKDKVDAPKIFSVEELATIYHLPGVSVVTPTLPRITSARKEAPSNLPIGNLPTIN